ncbi:MAG: ABC transporter substrate-binding protein [Trueperaceae bacterium]|nr:ABC transporter substrate-binding protein [Trueperaceae bacterium]
MLKRFLVKASFLVSLFALLLASAHAQDEKVIVIGHAEVAEAYDPAHAYSPTGGMINRATYDTLVTFPDTDASSIEPRLASSWSISEDGLVYTFNLRTDISFANGDSIAAEDVVFSFNRLKNVKAQPSFLTDPIVSVEAVDDATVQITIAEARPSFLSELTNSAFSVLNAEVVMANGGTDAADAAETDAAMDYLDQTSAGTGPYMLESWSPQEETVLVRNPNYWGTAPYFDRVIVVNIPEAATQKVALESGDIDLATDLSPDQVVQLEGNDNIGIFRGPASATHFILMNRDPEIGGPMANPLVAKAVRYALDYQGYRDLWAGSVTPGTNMWIGLQGAYGQDKAISRDLDMAKSLLAEAGYADGFETTLSYPDFTFNGVNLSTNAQKIQADLAEIGITVNLNPGEVQVSLEEYRNGQQGFAYWFWGPDKLDPVDFLEFLPGGKVASERTKWTPDMASQEILDLIAQAKIESDAATRTEIFNQLQDYAQEEGAFAPFSVPAVQTAFRADIQGYVWHPQWSLDVALLSRAE